MESQENEKLPAWYFRSDDKPMENNGSEEKWTLYPNSDEIEGNFQQYHSTLEDYEIKENPWARFQLDSNYSIDFRDNVQINANDILKQRLVGRFEGDLSTKNTLNRIDSIVFKKMRNMKIISDKDPNTIKSSLLFEGEQAFVNYNYLDIIFRIIDKAPNEKQAIDDLIQYSVNYINTYEDNKENETSKLKDLVIELENGEFKENSVK